MSKLILNTIAPFFILLLILASFATSCKKEELNREAKVTTGETSSIMATSATVSGEIIDLGEGVSDYGHCWATSENPAISDSLTSFGPAAKTMSYSSDLNHLLPDTKYYIRAYATSNDITVYGKTKSFNSLDGKVTLITADVTNIALNSAISGGDVVSVNGEEVLSKGVCWDTISSVSLIKNAGFTVNGSGLGIYTSDLTELLIGETYYVKAWAITSIDTSYGDLQTFTTLDGNPTITTSAISEITAFTATCGGEISSDNGSPVTARGVCWSTNLNPTINDSLTIDGTGIGSFNSNLINLEPGTTYYVRAYATNSIGTVYGDHVSFTTLSIVSDYDGNLYSVITIGTQEWMRENLRTTHFSNGEAIPHVTDNTSWSGLSSEAYCWYNNDGGTYKDTYGALYNWYTTIDIRNLCPAGWHVPSDEEMTILVDYLGGDDIAGGKLKESGTEHWISPNAGATNESGFTALPGGHRGADYGTFHEINEFGYWWNTTENSPIYAWSRYVNNLGANAVHSYSQKRVGFSVRCFEGELPLAKIEDATSITATSAILNGQVNPNNASTEVIFEYGDTTSYGSEATASESPVTGTTPVLVSVGINGLSELTTYHYRVKAVNSGGTTFSEDNTFTTLVKPTAATESATSVTSAAATLNGTVNANDLSTTVTFEYGLTTSYGSEITANESPVTGSTATAITADLGSLTASTTYHFRVKAVSTGGTSYGDDISFTTLQPPSATTGSATSVTSISATLNGTINANNLSTSVTFEYGITTSYGSTINATPGTVTGSSVTAVSASLTGLAAGTLYHYRIKAVSTGGTSYGSDMTFTLLSSPSVSTLMATAVSSNSATLNATVNANDFSTIVTFEYGLTTSYGSEVTADQSPVTGNINTDVSAYISGLAVSTTYHYRVKAVSTQGTTYGSDLTFITLSGLVAWYPYSGNANDASGYSNHGSVYGATLVNDRFGNANSAYNFDGTDDYIEISHSESLNISEQISISYWIKTETDAPYGFPYHIIEKYGSWGSGQRNADISWGIETNDGAYHQWALNLSFNQWHHIVLLYDGSSIKFYLDGQVENTTAASGLLNLNTNNILIGEYTLGGNYYLDGSLDDIRISNRAISDTEIEQLYTEGGYANTTVTDIEGNIYNTVIIGTQIWMLENLKTTRYNDGTSIPLITDPFEWSNMTTPGYCWYDNDEATYEDTYGALYNWYTVNTGNICPSGWHIPTDEEWTSLSTTLGGESIAGGKLKEIGTTHWLEPNVDATNIVGFTGLPGGQRNYSDGLFYYLGSLGQWWTTTEYSSTHAWTRHLVNSNSIITKTAGEKRYGYSVRCLKD